MQRDVLGLVNAGRATGGAGVHQIAGQLGLAVDGHALADQGLQGNSMPTTAKADLHAFVRQACGAQSRCHPGALQHFHGSLFEHTGADSSEHVFGAASFHDDRVDSFQAQQLA